MAESPLIDRLRSRAESITDTRIMLIVLAFIAGGLFVSLVAAALAAIGDAAQRWEWLAPVDAAFRWLDGFAQNFSTEMIGAAITFILLEILLAGRREKEAEQREKERLILQMGSPFREFAVEAARQLHARGWLKDGSLRRANLVGANLQGLNVGFVNFQEARLSRAILEEARLAGANCRRSLLDRANLKGTYLVSADLRGADLKRADLRMANMQAAKLERARLQDADLRGALWVTPEQLRQAKWLDGAFLPDGTKLLQNGDWRAALKAWCETAEIDELGCIVPAPLDEDDAQPDHAIP